MLFQIKGINKKYGKKESSFQALRGISFDVKAGESLGIVGKSGSGKSTLMHIMATLDTPTDGTIIYDNRELNRLSDKELDVIRNSEFGFVFQQFFLQANGTVLENVALPLKLAGAAQKERNSKAITLLKQIGLEDKADNKASDLSGGQKQRVCIARALVTDPKVIFADEPTGNLDTESGKVVIDTLFNLNKTEGITLIIVTHDNDIAAKCQRQIRIKDGRIEGKA